jgi:hypothetical protein
VPNSPADDTDEPFAGVWFGVNGMKYWLLDPVVDVEASLAGLLLVSDEEDEEFGKGVLEEC